MALVAAVAAGLLLGSLVASAILAAYALLAAAAMRRRVARVRHAVACIAALDQLNGHAARLRSGGEVELILLPDPELDAMAAAAQRLAERTGAPLADLLERIETQRRSQLRTAATASAQAAGAQATAVLLATLPVGGIGLGYLIGADPLAILLHTPIGAACAVAATVLQAAGLMWSDRISRPAGQTSPRRRQNPRRRLRQLGTPTDKPLSRRHTAIAAVGAATLAWLLVPNGFGLALGAASAIATAMILPRIPSPAQRAVQQQLNADLPLAADLMAAALRAGAPVDDAVLATARAMTGPAAQCLTAVARTLRLGATVEQAWQRLCDVPGGRRLATAAVRSADSGAALAGALSRCADDLRADAAVAGQASAARAGVLIVLPLGLCFLPAFVLAGLVPVVLAVLGEVL